MKAFEGLEPAGFWRYFGEIARIPRRSGDEGRVARYVIEEARRLGCEALVDGAGNVIARKPGRAGAPWVALQCHLDMVCEKREGVAHDFAKDPIRPRREGDWVRAEGTTLGADDGVGVALCLALMAEGGEHGPLEFVFTTNEEQGFTGVNGLEAGSLKARLLLNLDCGPDGVLTVGCAGSQATTLRLATVTDDMPLRDVPVEVAVSGLVGGHSGGNIKDGRANALRLLGRALMAAQRAPRVRVAEVSGGGARNAIPREAKAVLCVPEKYVVTVIESVAELEEELREEYRGIEADLRVLARTISYCPERVWKRAVQQRLVRLLLTVPHGVLAMSRDFEGLVETSTNLASVRMEDGAVVLSTMHRSSRPSALVHAGEQTAAVGLLAGAAVEQTEPSAGWTPDPAARLTALGTSLWTQLYGAAPRVTAVHAGLECAVLGSTFRGMQMLSYGPTVQGAHTPDERLQVTTVPRFVEFTRALLAALAEAPGA